MATIQAREKASACQHVNMQVEMVIGETPRGETAVAQFKDFRCPDCGRQFYIIDKTGVPAEIAAVPLTSELPSPQEIAKRQERARVANGKATALPKQQRQSDEIQARRSAEHESFSKALSQWIAVGGTAPPPTVAPGLVHLMTDLRGDASLLVLGSAGGLVPFVVDRGGINHAVVTDDGDVVSTLARVAKSSKLHPTSWEPEYGRLFDGIIVLEPLTSEWRERLPRLLKPGGDCWLVGSTSQYASELSAAWDYRPREIWKGEPGHLVHFHGDDAPLGNGPGTELANNLKSLNMPHCQQCRALARKMNGWGADGCRARLDEIVSDMLQRAREWWKHAKMRDKLSTWWKSSPRLAESIRAGRQIKNAEHDEMLREAVTKQVIAAIESYERKLAAAAPSSAPGSAP